MIRSHVLAVLSVGGLLMGCAPPASRGTAGADRASRAVQAACRQEVDRVYAAQNRADLSTRDQRDSPLSDNYVSGITSRGLSSLYGRDNEMASCVRNSQGGGRGATGPDDTGTGPVFTPINK